MGWLLGNRWRPWPTVGDIHEGSLRAGVCPLTDQLAALLLIERPGGDVFAGHPQSETRRPRSAHPTNSGQAPLRSLIGNQGGARAGKPRPVGLATPNACT